MVTELQKIEKVKARLVAAGVLLETLSPLDIAQIKAESLGIFDIEGPETPYGTAKGLMQLIDSTGQEWHQKLKLEGKYEPFDPHQNILIGIAYREFLRERYKGDVRLALAAYNWGLGNIDRLIRRVKSRDFDKVYPRLPAETKRYVVEIIADELLLRGQ